MEARSCGEVFVRNPEIFPSCREELKSWLDALFTVRPPVWDDMLLDGTLLAEVVGKKFGNIFERYFIPVRDTVAHALFDSDEPRASTDDLLIVEHVAKWLPTIKLMVRWMLKNEFPNDFLPHLPDPISP
jgi:hypothetical protein